MRVIYCVVALAVGLLASLGLARAGESVSLRKHGHKGGILRVALSTNGKLLLSSGFGGTHVWDVDTKQKMQTYDSGGYHFFSPNGLRSARSSPYEGVELFDCETGKLLAAMFVRGANCMAASPDGRFLAVGTHSLDKEADYGKKQKVRIFSLETYEKVHDLDAHVGAVTSIAWSDDGSLLFCGGELTFQGPSGFGFETIEGGVLGWSLADTATAFPTYAKSDVFHTYALAVSRDGSRVAFPDAKNQVQIWNTSTHAPVREIELPRKFGVVSLVFTADGQHLIIAAGLSNQVWVVSLETGKRTNRFRVDPKFCRSLALSRDGTRLATGGGSHLKVWQVAGILD